MFLALLNVYTHTWEVLGSGVQSVCRVFLSVVAEGRERWGLLWY